MIRAGVDEESAYEPGPDDGRFPRELPAEPAGGEGPGEEEAAAADGPAAADPAAAEKAPPLGPGELGSAIEAILFSTGEPVPIRQLAEVLEVSVHDVRESVENLRLELTESGRAFQLDEVAGGLQFLTRSRYHFWVAKFQQSRRAQRLSPAALETLAVIAYKQPISKASLESVRGVQCGPILKTLLDRGLIRITGREDALGKPLLYGTTARFLESLGLPSLDSLPQPELEAPAAEN